MTRWNTLGTGCVCGILGRGDVFGLGGVRGVCLGAGLDLGTSGLGVVLGRGRGRRPGRFVFGGAKERKSAS